MKVFLDDERLTPNDWIRTYTVAETVDILRTKNVTHLSLDNDLGEGVPEGYLVLNILEEIVFNDPTFPIPEITIHSSNAARVQSMKATINIIHKIRKNQTHV